MRKDSALLMEDLFGTYLLSYYIAICYIKNQWILK